MIKINKWSPLQNLSFDLNYGSTEGLNKGRRLCKQTLVGYRSAMADLSL